MENKIRKIEEFIRSSQLYYMFCYFTLDKLKEEAQSTDLFDIGFSYTPISKEEVPSLHITPILFITIFSVCTTEHDKEKKKEAYDYITKELLKLKNDQLMEQKYLDDLVFRLVYIGGECIKYIEFMIKNKIIDTNVTDAYGYNLLMYAQDVPSIEKLQKLGCDMSHTVSSNLSQFYGDNVYKLAVKAKNKTLIKKLTKYFSQNDISDANESTYQHFKEQKDVKQQFKAYILALKENNNDVFKFVEQHQNDYSELISYTDKRNENIVTNSIKYNNQDALSIMLKFPYYINNKKLFSNNNYLIDALNDGKSVIAQMLYEKGFCDKEKLLESLEDKKTYSKKLLHNLIDENYDVSLEARYYNQTSYALNKVAINDKTIEKFFDKADLLRHDLNRQRLDIIAIALQYEKQQGLNSFRAHLDNVLKAIAWCEGKNAKRAAAVLLQALPQDRNVIFDQLQSQEKKVWMTELMTENLMELLKPEEEEPIIRKSKI